MDKGLGDGRLTVASRRLGGSRMISPFVGREAELERLSAALSFAADSNGRAVFLVGEHGVGKTRLAQEALALARQRGFTVLEGRAFSLRTGLAYAPILEAFDPQLRNLDPVLLKRLLGDLPDLGRLFGGIECLPPIHSDGSDDPALAKTRLFSALSRLVERLSHEQPVALFIDDIHWADDATLELLHYLAQSQSQARVLLLSCYTPDGLNGSSILRDLLVSLKQDRLVDEVYIPRLRMDAVRDMVQGLLAGKASNELIETVYARTGGYPLYIESLVAGLIDAGYFLRPHAEKDIWAIEAARTGPLPPLLRDLILGRLEHLSATDRIVLDMIAISGDIATYSYLRTESGQSDKALFRSLRSLKAHCLVAERIDGADVGYSIVHPLIREVAIDDLPEIERRRHVAASEEHNLLLERRTGQPSFSRHEAKDPLFDHSPGATARVEPDPTPLPDLSGVLSDSQTPRGDAGWPASASLAVGIEGEREATSGGDNESLPWLLEQLGEAWGQFGDWRSAIDVWNEALALLTDGRKQAALSEKETMAVSRLHRRLALAEWDRGHFDVANAHLKASLIYSGEKSDPQSADLTFTRHRVFNQLGDAMGTLGSAAALIGMARRLSSPRAEAEANLVTTVFALAQGDIEDARKHALSALRLGESFPEGEALAMRLRGHAMLTLVGMRLGDHHFMRYHAERGLAVAQRPGAPPMEVVPRVRLAHAYFMAGLWDEAVRLGMEAVGAGRRIGNPHYLAYALAWRAMILALHGELPEAEACIAEVRIVHGSEVPEDRQVFSLVDIAEAALALERGQVERALGITRGFARPPRSWEATPAGVTSASKPMALMLLAEAQVAAGDPESALKTAHDLAFLGPPGAPYLTALSSRAEGLARLAQGQREGAISCFARAYETFTSLGMPFEAARALLEQASATTLTQPAVAAAAAHLSLATFEHIGAQRYADRARRLLRGLGITIPLRRRTSLSRGPLTIRQLQIARLVAEGLANSGIAERLVLSQRTVTTHLDHIYARLGIGSRTALSRYISETRLLSLEDDKA